MKSIRKYTTHIYGNTRNKIFLTFTDFYRYTRTIIFSYHKMVKTFQVLKKYNSIYL